MKKIIISIIMLVLMSISVFASVSWTVPSTATANTNFDIQIVTTAGDSGGYKILKPSTCTHVGYGTLGTDNYVRNNMGGSGTTSETFKCSSTATFSGEYTTGSGWLSFPSKTVTIGGTTPTGCEATVNSVRVEPNSVNANANVEVIADITWKGKCTFQGGLGFNNRYLDSSGNPNCVDDSCLFSVVSVTSNACDYGNTYYATVEGMESSTSKTDTFRFLVKPTKNNQYDIIASAHTACKQPPIAKKVVNDALKVGGCGYNSDCDTGSGICVRTTEGYNCGVNKECKSGVCTTITQCAPGTTTTAGCSNGQHKTCYADGSAYGNCEGGTPPPPPAKQCTEDGVTRDKEFWEKVKSDNSCAIADVIWIIGGILGLLIAVKMFGKK